MNKYTQTYLNELGKTAIDLQSLYGGGGIGAGNGTAIKDSKPKEDNRPLYEKAYGKGFGIGDGNHEKGWRGLGIGDDNGTAIKDSKPKEDNRPLYQKLFM